MRWLGRVFRHQRQPRAGRRGRSASGARRQRHPERNPGNLRRRTPADTACGGPRRRRKTRGPHQVVGELHRDQRRRDEQQPLAR